MVADHDLRVRAGSNKDVLDTTKCWRREDVVSGKRGTMMMYSVGCLVVCTSVAVRPKFIFFDSSLAIFPASFPAAPAIARVNSNGSDAIKQQLHH